MRMSLVPIVALGATLILACTPDTQPALTAPDASFSASADHATYVILGKGGKLPSDFAARVAAAGGEVVRAHGVIGVGIVTGSPEFASRMAAMNGIEAVAADMNVQWAPADAPGRGSELEAIVAEATPSADVASIGDNESFYAFQWAPAAIQAPEAWNAGYTGRGVRVAILDGAIYTSHVDLAGNVDVARSRSYFTGVPFNSDLGTFWHGTHVAGIVAARDNGIGTIGIAPNATLIGMKVLHNGTGPFAGIISAIVDAATSIEDGGAGADIINMSLGAQIEVTNENRQDVKALKKAIDLSTEYAYKRGVTVIVSAGNDGNNFDTSKELLKLPAENAHVLAVSATGPHGWALGKSDFARPAYYTDYGKSLVEVAAPGGTFGLWVVDRYDGLCTKVGPFATLTRFCEDFDAVMSTVRGGTASISSYNWAQGTSMAAPTVTGVVALMMEAHGKLNPSQVKTKLRQSSTDLGQPGNDIYYGHGWVNAYRAVR